MEPTTTAEPDTGRIGLEQLEPPPRRLGDIGRQPSSAGITDGVGASAASPCWREEQGAAGRQRAGGRAREGRGRAREGRAGSRRWRRAGWGVGLGRRSGLTKVGAPVRP
eukprot:4500746-Prymnesium_polylepis.1